MTSRRRRREQVAAQLALIGRYATRYAARCAEQMLTAERAEWR